MTFSTSNFWVQVHGLPHLWLFADNLKRIGSIVGTVTDIKFSDENGGVWRRFSRIQVEMTISKPLLPGIFLPRANLPILWISLKNEKLSEVCYNCGLIGHEDNFCHDNDFWIQNPQGIPFKVAGHWLKIDNNDTPPGIYSLDGE